jgi:hypothetical protein
MGFGWLIKRSAQLFIYKFLFIKKKCITVEIPNFHCSFGIYGPGARGSFPTSKAMHLSWMGDDRILGFQDSGEYLMLRFDATALLDSNSLPFITVGRSTLGKGSGDNCFSHSVQPKMLSTLNIIVAKHAVVCKYQSCKECIADQQCGWCSTSNTCLPGNDFSTCNDDTAPHCLSWMKTYCAGLSRWKTNLVFANQTLFLLDSVCSFKL